MISERKKEVLKRILKISLIIVIVYTCVSCVSTKLIYDMIFRRYSYAVWEADSVKSATGCSKVTEHSYECGSHRLLGALCESQKNNGCLVIIVSGFHSKISQYYGVIDEFTGSGFDVFYFDSTGHGRSGGISSVGFPQIINDLDSTLDFVINNPDFDYDNIVLFGHSRGAYAACTAVNSYSEDVCAVVSVNAVNTSMDGIMAYSEDAVGPVAYANYYFLQAYQRILFGNDISEKCAVDEINSSDVPILIIQSANDEKISAGEYSLYAERESITSGNVRFILYDKEGFDGHASIIHNSKGNANKEITDIAVDFFKINLQ